MLSTASIAIVLLTSGVVLADDASDATADAPVDFRREILPILSDRCFLCHGPDEAARPEGYEELRLDQRDAADAYGAFNTDDAGASLMLELITSDDPDLQMPPPESGKKTLDTDQTQLLRRWIQQGAEYQKHWSFEPPVKAKLPQPPAAQAKWPRNPIDHFVLQRLAKNDLIPSPEANRRTLARRAALSVIGLPPTAEQLRDFLSDESDDAYEKYVDRLLASKHYGERMAYVWLDIAHYSDTDGFQADAPRENWPWRDWVIQAYNDNMPFDQFTIEQFAGDLLPNATAEQRLATSFHRQHMTNGEGGRDPAESRVDYVLDRTNTMGTTWLGLTLGCAQCHTHKYDPITHHEYYQLTAFFNSIDEDGRAGNKAGPYLDYKIDDLESLLQIPRDALVTQKSKQATATTTAKAEVEDWIATRVKNRGQRQQQIENADWQPLEITDLKADEASIKFSREDKSQIWKAEPGKTGKASFVAQGSTAHQQIGSIRLEILPHKSHRAGGLSKADDGNVILTDVVIEVLRKQAGDESPQTIPLKIASAWADFEQQNHSIDHAFDPSNSTGWGVLSTDMTQPRTAVFQLDQPFELKTSDQLSVTLVQYSHESKNILGRFRLSCSPNVDARHETQADRLLATGDRDDEESLKELKGYYLAHHTAVQHTHRLVTNAEKALAKAKKRASVKVMVLKEREKPRTSYLLERGVWNAHGDVVQPKTPDVLNELETDTPDNPSRLDLAKWLVARDNPLTARVTVNRYWQMHFGAGIVRTMEDFGLQSEYPTHPQLLDWLAVEFMESGWDVKHLQKLIVTSATFRQSSKTNPELIEQDPSNHLLARGPRFRMPAALIRDNALAVTDLLADRQGGPPVKPHQPANVWFSSDQGRYPYIVARGDNLHRRSLYTYWRRNISPPAMFDAAQRRVCQVQTVRTNSPMHALNLLNDMTYIEAARALAIKAMKQSDVVEEQIAAAFQAALAREPSDRELEILTASWHQLASTYQAEPELALMLLDPGEAMSVEANDVAPVAAMTVISSTILNLDETLNLE